MTLRNLKFLLLTFLVIAVYACNNATQTEIPISDFFKDSERNTYKLSPDGKYISYIKRDEKDKQGFYIKSLSDGKERFVMPVKGFQDYWWTYNNQIIFSQLSIFSNENKIFAL